MDIEATSSSCCGELLNYIIHETTVFHHDPLPTTAAQPENISENPKKKKRKKSKVCSNKEEAETQRMTHIVVERNRRKLMNQHLSVLRSLLPESYIQRGDQASIVGGAIEFVKELEYLLQSLEAQKSLLTQQQQQNSIIHDQNSTFGTNLTKEFEIPQLPLCFHKLFSSPWSSQVPNKNNSISKATMADVEVNLVQTHANLRILSRKRLTQLSKMIVFLQTCNLSILHLSVNTLDPLVFYSISLKVEEGCWLKSADDIAGAVHHILDLIEEEATLSIDGKTKN